MAGRFRSWTAGPRKVVRHVSLPRLVRLELDGDIKTVAAMLKHLMLPVVKDVRLTGSFNERMHGGVETQAMFCRLAQLLMPDGDGTLPITELSLSQHFSGAFHFMGTVRHAAAGRDPTSLDLRLHTGSEDLSSSFTFDTLFPEVLSAIQSRAPLSLSIARLNLFAPQWFDALSRHVAVIQSISIDGASFDSFFDFLRIGYVDAIGEVLPHLEVLRLREFAPSDVMRWVIVVWLRARMDRKAALRKLVFDRCRRDTLPGRWLDELREVMSDRDYNAVVVENPM
ncbi:hypothetical protein EWM64_g9854 [Hericium alpestre]|uniref:Uncharacterized protein n=1 Tax=Hericium alpestre TaxID=135208 RepID=A0A4Y9ZKK2_9AGAM|nr:hypothetical protein EWM64_g9854 [Hericium alpestre]